MFRSISFLSPLALVLASGCATTTPVAAPEPADWQPSAGAPAAPVATSAAAAQDEVELEGNRASATFGLGFTGDPTTFLLGASYDVPLSNTGLSVGPQAQFGVSGDDTIVAPTLSVMKEFNVSDSGDLGRLRPFLRGGLGFAYLHKDHRRGDNDAIGFLINFGGGARYWLNEDWTIGTEMLFNFLPDEVLDENFYFSWQVAQLEFNF